MTTISLKDEFFDLQCSLQEDGSKAEDVLRAFVGLMVTQTYRLSSIISALDEVLYDYKEQLRICNENNNNE